VFAQFKRRLIMFKGSRKELLMAVNPFIFAIMQLILWVIVLTNDKKQLAKTKRA